MYCAAHFDEFTIFAPLQNGNLCGGVQTDVTSEEFESRVSDEQLSLPLPRWLSTTARLPPSLPPSLFPLIPSYEGRQRGGAKKAARNPRSPTHGRGRGSPSAFSCRLHYGFLIATRRGSLDARCHRVFYCSSKARLLFGPPRDFVVYENVEDKSTCRRAMSSPLHSSICNTHLVIPPLK